MIFPSKIHAGIRDDESTPFPLPVDCPLFVKLRSDAMNTISSIIPDLRKGYQLKNVRAFSKWFLDKKDAHGKINYGNFREFLVL